MRMQAQKVKVYAEKAQGDVGLDFAWLDDVTYGDWQTYHDLIRSMFLVCALRVAMALIPSFFCSVSENFTAVAHALLTGDHSDPTAIHVEPMEDVLAESLNQVNRDVTDLIEGFNALLKQMQGRGRETFEEVLTALIAVKDRQKQSEEEINKEEEVSILPIEPTSTSVPTPEGGLEEGVGELFLGRSKEEIEEKLAAVSLEAREEL